MSDDGGHRDNVYHLGNKDLVAIGDELRRMYDFYLHSKPSPRIERLMGLINDNGPPKPDGNPKPTGSRPEPEEEKAPPP